MCKNVFAFLLAAAGSLLSPDIGRAQIAPKDSTVPASGVIGKSILAIGYPVGGGSTNVDFKNTELIAEAGGKAKVEAKAAVTTVEVQIQGLKPPTELGAEFLTYVLWAVSTEGRAINLGGIPLGDDGRGKLKTTTLLRSFSLFVTSEPYSAVRRPSEMLILENVARKDTKGKRFTVNDYKLMRRNQYERPDNPLALAPDLKNVPLEMYEARNALDIAKARRADKFAPDIFIRAEGALRTAESALASKASRKDVMSSATQAAQFAEDARALSVDRQEQERITAERAAAAAKAQADREAKAAAAAAEARRRADKEARRQAELAAAGQTQVRAEAAALEAQMRVQAKIAATRARAEANVLQAKEEAARTDTERGRQAAADLRARLLDQFKRILETRDSPRGLVVTMADVLFDTGKFDLRLDTRERLARFSGIVLAHAGLNIEVEGHTDNAGGDQLNQKLSERWAQTVRGYLIKLGLEGDSMTAVGFGKLPVADNSAAAGRQKNRRVELIVSGGVIGVKIGK